MFTSNKMSLLLVLGACLTVKAFEADMYDNLALRKPATQSSISSPLVNATASKANDGNRSNIEDMFANSCMHTDFTDKKTHFREAWWTVDLGFVFRIHEVLVTNRDWGTWPHDSGPGRFVGFSIFVSNTSVFKNGTMCFQQNGSKPNVQRTSYPCSAIGRFVTVYNNRTQTPLPAGYSNESILELCEVEIPGCRFQHFGKGCNQTCFCKDVTCDYKNGQCNRKCQPGYIGESCNKTCTPGIYGDNCSLTCVNCGGNKVCNQSGVCLDGCAPGYFPGNDPGCTQHCGKCLGTRCNLDGTCPQECVGGYYKSNCVEKCPGNCYNGLCYKESGKCILCKTGYFGEHCDIECPRFCLRRTCEIGSGKCFGCEPGHYGFNCTDECLNCGGFKACNDSGVCLDGCEIGYISDHTPGCSLKCEHCEEDMASNLTIPLVIGISSGVLLVLLGTTLNVVWYRKKRKHADNGTQQYDRYVAGQVTDHTYADIQLGIQNTHVSLDDEMAAANNRDTPQRLEQNTDTHAQ